MLGRTHGMRAGIVGPLHGAHGTRPVNDGGGDGVSVGGAGGDCGAGDLVGQLKRHVFLGLHRLRAGSGSEEGQGEGGGRMLL